MRTAQQHTDERLAYLDEIIEPETTPYVTLKMSFNLRTPTTTHDEPTVASVPYQLNLNTEGRTELVHCAVSSVNKMLQS